jgi:hypothetical protein
MFESLYQECKACGALYIDGELHQRFHDSIGVTYQKAFGLTDEEYEQFTGTSVKDRNERLAATPNPRQPA